MRQEHETAKGFNELKEITQNIQTLKSESSAQAQKSRLNPTKKAFSERQKTRLSHTPRKRGQR
ncbi:hypothetical protein [Helicobacter pylori]|uniref:hypothetical protein n=1 Tax=Helicobacter pylori TaxID=210 RepID=UPI001AFC67E0|nr:hypothetical protein [Helicobacter pylori]QQO40101.1 hypothetical protein [Helicobacter phage COL 23-PUJ]